VLVPIEHLTPQGMSAAFAALAIERADWTAERVALFDRGFALYWSRGAALAARTRSWAPPRRRHVAVVDDPLAVRPYVQLLNTSAWMVYGADLDPAGSHPELLAYLLVLGDRMAMTGDVSAAPVHTALWWLERTEAECAAFAAAAARSSRPDGDGLRAVAAGLAWLRDLHHDRLRPPRVIGAYRAIPGTGLLVSPRWVDAPPALAVTWDGVATQALDRYRERHRAPSAAPVAALGAWLGETVPSVLVAAGARIVWESEQAARLGPLRRALEGAPAAAVEDVHQDLSTIERVTRAFHAAVVDPSALPAVPPDNTMQAGYTYLHRERRRIVYDLDEPGLERLGGPALPYARLMLAARTAHEWGHLADAGGCVPRWASDEQWHTDRRALAALLDEVVRDAPATVRRLTVADERDLARDRPLGEVLVRVFTSRLPDYRANLVARHLLLPAERETYVRQNVRTLAPEYALAQCWRLLIRYLFEYQYLQPALGMTAVAEPFAFFVGSTWFDRDFFATGILDAERFTRLAAAAARLCASYAVDPTTLRFA
jgi:hypothetical protein